jgi:hypothetical protein
MSFAAFEDIWRIAVSGQKSTDSILLL